MLRSNLLTLSVLLALSAAYVAPTYSPSEVVQNMHDIPRFVGDNDFDYHDKLYIKGVLLIGAPFVVIGALCLIIFPIIAFCRCICNADAQSKGPGGVRRTCHAIVLVLVLAGVALTISGNLITDNGVDKATDALDDSASLVHKARDLTSILQSYATATNDDIESLVARCEAVESATTELHDYTTLLWSECQSILNLTDGMPSTIREFADDIEHGNKIRTIFTASACAFVGFCCLLALFSLCSLCACKGDDSCCASCGSCIGRVILPFVLVVCTLSFIMAGIELVVTIGSSDFCMTPDDNILALAPESDVETFSYYVTCSGNNTLGKDIDNAATFLSSALNSVDALRSAAIADGCDTESLDLITSMENELTEAMPVLNMTVAVTECEGINKLYVQFVHDGFCTDAVYGLMCLWVGAAWAAVWLFVALCDHRSITAIGKKIDRDGYIILGDRNAGH